MVLPSFLSRTASLLLMVLIVLAATPAQARTRGRGDTGPAGPQSASECAALFGRLGEHAQNAEARRRVYWLHEESEGITLAHSSESWVEPVEAELKGLQLRGVGSGLAVVRVSTDLGAKLGCPAADYAVRQDDDLGRGTRILAVLQAGLLLERAGRLVYLRAPWAREPRWFLAWSAPGMVRVPEGDTSGTGSERYRYRLLERE